MKQYLPAKASIKSGLLLIGIVIGYYVIDSLSLFSFLGHTVYNLVVKPVYWGIIIFIAWRYPRIRPKSKLRFRDNIYFWSIFYGIVHVVVWFAAGFLDGFGKSPYDLSLIGILINLISVGSMMTGQELVRGHIVSNMTKEENYLIYIMTAVLFTVISFRMNQFTALKDLEEAVTFTAEFVAPKFSKNIMATYLTNIGGPAASLLYMGILSGVEYLTPILPNLKWITSALIGILCPVFSMMSVQDMYLKAIKQTGKLRGKAESPLGWLITSIISICMIWFTVGVFPVYPSVIATGSMEPIIKPGDVILVKKIGDQTIQKGDIIQFMRESILISHRVVEIIEDKEGTKYRTKGDNNNAEDIHLVKPEDVKGKIISVVPKIGWPTLLLKSENSKTLHNSELQDYTGSY